MVRVEQLKGHPVFIVKPHSLRLFSENCVHALPRENLRKLGRKPLDVNPGITAIGNEREPIFLMEQSRQVYGVRLQTNVETPIRIKYQTVHGQPAKTKEGFTSDGLALNTITFDEPVAAQMFSIYTLNPDAKFAFVEIVTCAVVQTTTPSSSDTARPSDCIYDVTPKELAQKKPEVFSGGVTAQLTDAGVVEYIFPIPRSPTEVHLQTTSGQAFQAVLVSSDGSQETTLLSSDKEKPAVTSLPAKTDIVKIHIKTTNGTPLTATDLTSLEVVACVSASTALTAITPITTSAPSDCIFDIKTEELANGKDIPYANGGSAKMDNGMMEIALPQAMHVAEAVVQTTDSRALEIVIYKKDGKTASYPMNNVKDKKITIPISDGSEVVRMEIRNVDKSPLKTSQIYYFEVFACKAPLTTQRPQVTTVITLEPTTTATTPPLDCVYHISDEPKLLMQKQFKDAVAYFSKEKNEITIIFDYPKDFTGVILQTTNGNPITIEVKDENGNLQVEEVSSRNEML
jgi:hypothetical protein